MESQQSARNRRPSFARLVTLALAIGVCTPLAAAPRPEARVVINTDRYIVGSKWTLDLIVDSPDPLSVRLSVPTLPPSLVLVDGPYIRETSWEKVPGTLTRATKVSLTLRALAPGIVEVGPFEVRVGGLVLPVAPVTLYLLASDEAKRRFPVELRWVKPEGPFYEGQAIPLLLQARNLDTLAQPDDLGLAAPASALWEKAVGLGEIEINSVGEDRLMNIPWGGWMVIPTKKGTLTVPAVKATVTGLTRTVAPLSLEVLPLPPEVAGGRAVGDFSYSVDAKEGEGAQGGQLVVTQEIKGRGNFPYLELPPVAIEGLTLVSRQVGTRYRAARGGYEGSLVVTWKFSTDQPRTLTLILPGFHAFQPTTGRVDTWDPRAVVVHLTLPVSTEVSAVPAAQPLSWEQVLQARPWSFERDGSWLLLLAPGLLVWGASFLRPGRKRGMVVLMAVSMSTLSAVSAPYSGFDLALKASGAEAVSRWSSLATEHPDEPGLWYNKALACREAGRTSEAVHAYRMALRTGFQGPAAAAGLASLEEKELLTDQFVPWGGPSSNLLLLLLVVGLNLCFILWGFQRWTGSASWLVALSVALMFTLGSAGLFVASQMAQAEPDAVVGLTDAAIRKVPGDLAETWMTLKAGTVVKVQGASQRWVLVQTGYGLEGWVEESGLLSLGRGR